MFASKNSTVNRSKMVNQKQQYWHGEGKLPEGPYIAAYRKGPIYSRLKQHLKNNNIKLSGTVHFDIYNNNPWLWQINPDKFYGFIIDAYNDIMGKGKQTRFKEDDIDLEEEEDDDTIESFEGGHRSPSPQTSSIMKASRYGGGGGGVDGIGQSMSNMNISSMARVMVRLALTADDSKSVNGWMTWKSDTGRVSDDGTKMYEELNMKKRVAHPKDIPKHKLWLHVDKNGEGTMLEEECPGK